MQYQIDGNPEYGQLSVQLEPGESFLAEAGAMSWMSPGMQMKSRLMGGMLKSVVRKVVGGESLFAGEYSHPQGGSVSFSPSVPGSLMSRPVGDDEFTLTGGSFMGCTPGVEMSMRFGGLKSFFSGEGVFFIICKGQGELFFNSFGAIVEKEIDGEFIVDTGHVVGWEQGLDYSIGGMGGLKSTLFSGEGLVMRFKGKGKLYLQTRTIGGTVGWLSPNLR